MNGTVRAGRRAASGLLVTLLITGALSLWVARPAAADTCLVVTCPPGAAQVVGGAESLIPGLGAAASVIGSVGGAVGGAVASVAQAILDQVGQGVANAVSSLYGEVSTFLTASSSPQVTVGSFVAGNGAYHQVAELAALAMVLFMFFAVIQGVFAGDPAAMVGRMLRDIPLAVLAIFGFPWAVDQLVGLVDAVCASLLPTGATLTTISQVYAADHVRALVGFAIPAILTELFVFLGGLLIYAELVVRAALVTVVVALAPLSFAAMVWPAARGAARKVIELVVAIVLSKLAIWVALAVGIGLFQTQAQTAVPSAQAWGQMISGAAIIGVAVFAPFVVWRLLPIAEAAMVAQGLSRMPGRAAINTAQTASMVRGRGGGSPGGGDGGGGGEHPALADLPSRSLGADDDHPEAGPTGPAGGRPAARGGPGGAGPAPAAGATGGGTAGTPAAGGASVGAAGAAAGPAVAVVAAAKAVKDHVVASADNASGGANPGVTAGGWSFRKVDGRGGDH